MKYHDKNIIGIKFYPSWFGDSEVYKIYNVKSDITSYIEIKTSIIFTCNTGRVLELLNSENLKDKWVVVNYKFPWYYKLLKLFK